MKQNRYTYVLLIVFSGLLYCPEISARPAWLNKLIAYFTSKKEQLNRLKANYSSFSQRRTFSTTQSLQAIPQNKPSKTPAKYTDFEIKDFIASQTVLPARLQGLPILHFHSLGQQSGSTCGHYTLSNAAAIQQLYFENKQLNDMHIQDYARINLATTLSILSMSNLEALLHQLTNKMPGINESHALIVMGSKIRNKIRMNYNLNTDTYEYLNDPALGTSGNVIITNEVFNRFNSSKTFEDIINNRAIFAYNLCQNPKTLLSVEKNEPLLESIKADLTETQRLQKIDLPNQARKNMTNGAYILALKNLFFITSQKNDYPIEFRGSGPLIDKELQDVQGELHTLFSSKEVVTNNDILKFNLKNSLLPILNKMKEASYENIIHFACLLGHTDSGHWVYIGIIKRKNQPPFIVYMNSIQATIASQSSLVNILNYLANGLGLKPDSTIHSPQQTDDKQTESEALARKMAAEFHDEEVARRLQEQYNAELKQTQTKKVHKQPFETSKKEIEAARRLQEQQDAELARKINQEERDFEYAQQLEKKEKQLADSEALARQLAQEEKESQHTIYSRTRRKK